jgi:hypothetical protein
MDSRTLREIASVRWPSITTTPSFVTMIPLLKVEETLRRIIAVKIDVAAGLYLPETMGSVSSWAGGKSASLKNETKKRSRPSGVSHGV